MGELLVADETLLLRLAAIMQACGLLQLSTAPKSALERARQATLGYLQQPGIND